MRRLSALTMLSRRPVLVALLLFCGFLAWGQATPWLEQRRRLVEESASLVAQQAALSRYKALGVVIDAAMARALSADAGLVRVRVAFIHPPATPSNLALIRWDLTNAMTQPGHVVGPLRSDLPISDWSDYLDSLLLHRCAARRVSELTQEATIERANAMRITGFVVCPIITPRGALVGAVYGSWDQGDPEPVDMVRTEHAVRAAADTIGAAVTEGN